MNLKAVLTLFLIIPALVSSAQDISKDFERAAFYNVFASKDLEAVNAQLNILKAFDFKEKKAFEGALLMKKAELADGPGKKLSLFKSGHEKLEQAISEDSTNTEFRFLRLIIQENAPKILGYHEKVEEDSLYVLNHFKDLLPVIQEAIIDYSKRSAILNSDNLREALE